MFCCFSGHRPHILKGSNDENSDYIIKLKEAIGKAVEEAIKDGYFDFYTGMAKGVDTYAAEYVLSKAKNDNRIQLHAAIPCEEQSNYWDQEEKSRYLYLLSKCTTKTYTSKSYYDGCMLLRNNFMVDNSQRLIAVWNGQARGGTAYTVRYAKKLGKQIYLIRPSDLTTTYL